MGEHFRDPADVLDRLRNAGYLGDESIASVVFLADRLDKPVLVEGPAGVGKTELAKTLATITGSRLLRLQCYEGLDESRALYEWNYRKQLMRIQAGGGVPEGASGWKDIEADIFSEPYLLERPLLAAVRANDDVVLLIDEVDRVEVETEALLLEVLAEFQVTIPELGTITGTRHPLVVLTSNNTRELSEALRRRCLYLALEYPTAEREREILLARIPGIEDRLARQVAGVVRAARRLELRKTPSIGESIDWARALMALGHVDITQPALAETLPVLIKSRPDLVTASRELTVAAQPRQDAPG
ncbi:MAG: MoxR family ATPase [Candidatus Dormiibacterota bacterium]